MADRARDAQDVGRGDIRAAAYLHCPGGLLESQVGKALPGRAGKAVTSRNWATVLKLAALANAA